MLSVFRNLGASEPAHRVCFGMGPATEIRRSNKGFWPMVADDEGGNAWATELSAVGFPQGAIFTHGPLKF